MKNSADSLAAIRRVHDKAAEHIYQPKPACCPGCTLARQIPGLLDDIAEVAAEVTRLRKATCECPTGDYACDGGTVWGPCPHVPTCDEAGDDGIEAIAYCECKTCHPERAVA